jgi:hypothetical protein
MMIADLVVAPLILLMILITILGGTATNSATSASGTVLNSPIVYQGEVNIQQWLASTPPPLPGGTIVSYYGQMPAPTPAKPQLDSTVANYRIASFIVLSHGTFYKVSVEEELNGQNASVVSNAPSIIPLGPTANISSAISSPWSGINPTGDPPNGALAQSIQGWANAFTSGSPASLALAVGDPNSSDHYVPLSGVSQVQSTVLYYAPTSTTTAIAEVNLAIAWSGHPLPKAANYAFDILIERPLSAAPVVVAWGPPGSGPSLVPYQNAVR